MFEDTLLFDGKRLIKMGIVDYGNMVRNTFSSARVGPSTNRSISSSVRISVLQRSRIFKFCEKLHAPFRLEFLPRVRSFFSLPFPPSPLFSFLFSFSTPPRNLSPRYKSLENWCRYRCSVVINASCVSPRVWRSIFYARNTRIANTSYA